MYYSPGMLAKVVDSQTDRVMGTRGGYWVEHPGNWVEHPGTGYWVTDFYQVTGSPGDAFRGVWGCEGW